MLNTLVSVIIPVYNAEAHLAHTLESVVQQDYAELEIIVVDDASTDSTRNIAQTILQESGRPFRIIDHAKNRGVSAARNTGLASAKGSYVWFCDGDDIAEKNFVSFLCGEAERKSADLVFCSLKQFYEDDDRFSDEQIISLNSLEPEDYLEAWAKGKILFWSVWNFMFRRDFLSRNNFRFNENSILGEDLEFVLKAITAASKVSSMKDMLYTYVHHSTQSSKRNKEPVMLHSLEVSRLRAWRYLLRRTQSRRVKNYILSFCIPDTLLKKFTTCAQSGDKEHYRRLTNFLKHRKVRKIFLSTAKFVITVPELFFKSVVLVYAPNLYYTLRNKS